MKNLFDQQINTSMKENLDSIHASDELKSKLLERLYAEKAPSENKATTLTAIRPDYVFKNHEPNQTHIKWIVTALFASILVCVSSLLITTLVKHNVASDPIQESISVVEHQQPEENSLVICDTIDEEPIKKFRTREMSQKEELIKAKENTFSYNSRARRV